MNRKPLHKSGFLLFWAIYMLMTSSIIKYIDKLIESELTNVNPQSSASSNVDINAMIDKEINKPVFDFLDGKEKEEKDNLNYHNRIKSIERDPNKKKVTDSEITAHKKSIEKITKLRMDLKAKQEELRKQQLAQQLNMKSQMDKMQNPENTDSNFNSIRQQVGAIVREQFNNMPDIQKYDALPIITRASVHPIEEAMPPVPAPAPMPSPAPAAPQPPRAKVLKVNFDNHTPQPFQVEFTERGFLIGSTRLSFEVIETALSKNFTITLDNGNGLVLDAIKMQKILKYKNHV